MIGCEDFIQFERGANQMRAAQIYLTNQMKQTIKKEVVFIC